MAFSGDIENLHIVDITQLIHTTRMSGTLAVRGSRGESRLVFSNGYIVGANHLNSRVRIGSVLVKLNVITLEDLSLALELQKRAGKDRKPLITTLIEMGKLRHEDAYRWLGKLIEMTLVELIGWSKGAFTFDTENIAVTPEFSYPIGTMEQDIIIDTQMALMDSLRIFDERERDRRSGKNVPAFEELFPEVIPSEAPLESAGRKSFITADDLGLAGIDQLQQKIPQSFSVEEIFDPVEIHRHKIKEILSGFSPEEQETFVSFLKKSSIIINVHRGSKSHTGQSHALILYSKDELIKYSVMTICKDENIFVFATDTEEELDRFIAQCLSIKTLPVLVFDKHKTSEEAFSEEKVVALRKKVKKRYPQIPIIQMTSPSDFTFSMQSFNDGIRAVFPRPLKETGKETFIKDTIFFLDTFKSYIKGMFYEQKVIDTFDTRLGKLKDRILSLRDLNDTTDVSSSILQYVSEMFERSITFIVRPNELIGEWAIGVYAEKNTGLTSATRLKIPLTKPSVFRNVIETGQFFFGESDDEVLKDHLFKLIGIPLKPAIILLPMKSREGVMAMTYGDFGMKEPQPLQIDLLEILADQAGLVLEKLLYRRHLNKVS